MLRTSYVAQRRKRSTYHSASKSLHPLKKGLGSSTLQCWEFNIPTAQISRGSIASVTCLVHGTILAKLSFLSKDSCTGRFLIVHVTIGPNMIPWPDSTQTLRELPKFFCKGAQTGEGSIAALLHGQAILGKQSTSPRPGTVTQTEPTSLEPPTQDSDDDTSRSASYR